MFSRSPQSVSSSNMLTAILDTSIEGMIVVDPTLRITAANSSAQTAFGRNIGRLQGRRLTEILRDMTLHAVFQNALRNSEVGDLRFEFTGAEKRTYNVHVAPVELEGTLHALGVFYDVTQVERLETARQEFLSNISHELRTPLTSILAFVETLEDGGLEDGEKRRFIAVIRRNAERMHALIADVAELSMIETGKISFEPADIKLHRVVDEIFTSLSAKANAKSVKLVNNVPEPATVYADAIRIEQMLINLVDNAIKFNRDGGTVTVDLETVSAHTRIFVTDTGEGILPEQLHRVFERFYRVDRGRTREVGGTGLGLAIVKHLARLHGGDVHAKSDLGRGTAFSIELPTR